MSDRYQAHETSPKAVATLTKIWEREGRPWDWAKEVTHAQLRAAGIKVILSGASGWNACANASVQVRLNGEVRWLDVHFAGWAFQPGTVSFRIVRTDEEYAAEVEADRLERRANGIFDF
jgi:hypothetical protein